ncbi:hypothetical protein [Wolbachia endosymbiont (group A) of Rhinocyllus conicus]|uniref:hypothetical protein n=1 Tax=Wolbachia endosymbiont (group A) of Rhinocyllus conicus TaxID=2954053 RepID=UPI002226A3FF|nr:hypothetical protein [Wolbachia endosymbiont (group A) of Rhinocyllus conicus]
MLAPLAAFAATPLGMSVLAFVAVALICLAVYAISKNNEISELKAWKLSVSSDYAHLVLQVLSEDSKFIEENYKVDDKHRIDCVNSKGEVYRITLDGHVKYKDNDHPILLGSTYLFRVSSLDVKDGEGKYVSINDRSKQLETLGLGLEDQYPKELSITFMPSTVMQKPAAEQGKTGRNK